MPDEADLIIVGAGVLGTFHAYFALQEGLRVTLLEKDLAPQGATVRNFGLVIPSGMARGRWQALGLESTRIYTELQGRLEVSVRQNGTVYLASDEHERVLLEELAAYNQSIGYACEVLTPEACLRRYPGLKASYCTGGLFFPDEISVEPEIMIRRVIGYLVEQRGLVYRPQTTVIDCSSKAGRVEVKASTGRIYRADQAVLCNGSEFKTLFPTLFAESPIEVTKLHMMQTVPQAGLTLPGGILTGLSIRRYESFQACPSFRGLTHDPLNPKLKEWGIHILFKQAADGSILIGDSHEYRDVREADALGFDVNEAINRLILEEARKVFELPSWQLQRAWYGVYAQTKTGDLFRHSLDGRIHIITAIGGKGMTAGPAIARAHIEQLLGQSAGPWGTIPAKKRPGPDNR